MQLAPHEHVAPLSHWIVQLPLVHAALQVDPDAHVVLQSPLAQVTLQLPPDGHVVLQSPLLHATLHGPAPHVLLQSPLVHCRLHEPAGGHVMSQFALVQAQLPEPHAHAPPLGHATGGGYDGFELQATTAANRARSEADRKRMDVGYQPGAGAPSLAGHASSSSTLAAATGLFGSSCQASERTVATRRPWRTTSARANVSTVRAERR